MAQAKRRAHILDIRPPLSAVFLRQLWPAAEFEIQSCLQYVLYPGYLGQDHLSILCLAGPHRDSAFHSHIQVPWANLAHLPRQKKVPLSKSASSRAGPLLPPGRRHSNFA